MGAHDSNRIIAGDYKLAGLRVSSSTVRSSTIEVSFLRAARFRRNLSAFFFRALPFGRVGSEVSGIPHLLEMY